MSLHHCSKRYVQVKLHPARQFRKREVHLGPCIKRLPLPAARFTACRLAAVPWDTRSTATATTTAAGRGAGGPMFFHVRGWHVGTGTHTWIRAPAGTAPSHGTLGARLHIGPVQR